VCMISMIRSGHTNVFKYQEICSIHNRFSGLFRLF
jgi:hypothetical protein